MENSISDPIKINRKNAWVNAEFGLIKLVFPQTDVNTIETLAGITRNPEPGLETGWVTIQGEQIPIYCLADNMTLLTTLQDAIRFVLLVKSKQGLFGLACERIKPFTALSPIEIYSVPNCMKTKDSPIAHITLIENEIAYIIHADDLYRYIHLPTNTEESMDEYQYGQC